MKDLSALEILTTATVSNGSVDYITSAKQITARIPVELYCHLEVIAHHSNLSRNKVVSLLLEDSVENYYSELNNKKDVLKKLKDDFTSKFKSMSSDSSITDFEDTK